MLVNTIVELAKKDFEQKMKNMDITGFWCPAPLLPERIEEGVDYLILLKSGKEIIHAVPLFLHGHDSDGNPETTITLFNQKIGHFNLEDVAYFSEILYPEEYLEQFNGE